MILSNKTVERVAIVTNISWNLYNFRRGLAKSIKEAGYEPVLFAAPDTYEEKLKEEGWIFVPVHHLQRTGINPVADIQLFFEFKNLFKQHNIRFVLNYNAKPLVYASLAASFLSIPFVPTISGLAGPFSGNRTIVRQIVKVLYKLAFEKCSKVVFQNSEDREYFISKKIVSSNKTAIVNGSGVNIEKFKTEYYQNPSNGNLVFLMFSRLSRTKGVYHYIEAARAIKADYPDVEFKLAGPFDLDKFAIKKEEVDQWQNEGVVQYLGKSDFIQKEISIADVVVYPSYYKEGIPKALMEAAAMSRPIITTDNVGCREVVRDGSNGFLILKKSTPALVDAFKKFISMDEIRRTEMGSASRKIAEERFNEKDVFEVYKSLIRSYIQ